MKTKTNQIMNLDFTTNNNESSRDHIVIKIIFYIDTQMKTIVITDFAGKEAPLRFDKFFNKFKDEVVKKQNKLDNIIKIGLANEMEDNVKNKYEYLKSQGFMSKNDEGLLEYWNSIEHFDGTILPHVEIYWTINYILHAKKDLSPWKEVVGKYFYVKDYVEDFQIKWEKMTPEWNIKIFFDNFYKNSRKIDP